MDIDEAWLFHQWFGELARQGKAVAFQPGPSGLPAGYREAAPGQWRNELTGNQEVARAEPDFVVERLKDLEYEAGAAAVVELIKRWPSWMGPLVQALVEAGDSGSGPLASLAPADREDAESHGRADPAWLRAVMFGETPVAPPEIGEDEGQILRLLLFKLALEALDPEDYDPVRDSGRLGLARRYLLALAALLRGEEEEEEEEKEEEDEEGAERRERERQAKADRDYWRWRLLEVLRIRAAVLALALAGVGSRLPGQPAAPLPVGLPPGVIRLHHEDPILSQTRRRVRERGPGGKFTGKVSERTVPTMRIDLDSRLGRAIRIIDDDTGRKDPPRGALLRIVTSPGHVQWVMAVRKINGRLSWRGKERDDPRRVKLRDQQQAEVIQLVDHRSGKPRMVELLASPRSEYFALAIEFAEEFARLQERVK